MCAVWPHVAHVQNQYPTRDLLETFFPLQIVKMQSGNTSI